MLCEVNNISQTVYLSDQLTIGRANRTESETGGRAMSGRTGWNNLSPVKASGLYKQVEEQFTALIRSGELRPGDRLPSERELQERLQVSRAVLREALRVLEAKGLVVSGQGKGRFLRATDPALGGGENPWVSLEKVSLVDIYEVRLLLEPAAASWAALRATPADLAHLDAALDRIRGHERDWHEEDFPFHLAVAAASHNEMTLRILQMQFGLMNQYSPDVYHRLLAEETIEQWAVEHEEIARAVKQGDADRAGRLMYDHVHRAYTLLRES